MQKNILNHFAIADPIMYRVLSNHPQDIPDPKPSSEYFYQLSRAIAFQQLSGKAATTIFNRLLELINHDFQPQIILALSDEQLRSVGVSRQKAGYLRSIAEHFRDGKVSSEDLANMSDEEVIADLTQIKGVGTWTAEMFLLFTMGRENIFSTKDLGLANGIKMLYGKNVSEISVLIDSWSPYSSYASLALWAVADGEAEI